MGNGPFELCASIGKVLNTKQRGPANRQRRRLDGLREIEVDDLITLRGCQSIEGSYLDAAGYPRESQLPANYQYPAAAPVVARTPPPRSPEQASTESPATTRANNPSGIKF